MDAPTPTVETVLVPVDGSEASLTAVEYAVAVAGAYGARAHVVHVLAGDTARAVASGAVDAAAAAAEGDAISAAVRDLAAGAGVDVTLSTATGFSARRKLVHPGSVILDCAEEVDADFLVIPRASVHGDPGEVLEKAAEYVLLYASQPVLSV